MPEARANAAASRTDPSGGWAGIDDGSVNSRRRIVALELQLLEIQLPLNRVHDIVADDAFITKSNHLAPLRVDHLAAHLAIIGRRRLIPTMDAVALAARVPVNAMAVPFSNRSRDVRKVWLAGNNRVNPGHPRLGRLETRLGQFHFVATVV